MSATTPSLGRLAEVACLIEARTPKPGNVHPGAAFDDASYEDFVASAAAIKPVFDQAGERCLGQTVLEAVRATRQVVNTNTNLGIILLLAPLAMSKETVLVHTAPERESLRAAVSGILTATTTADAEAVYGAIRLARPGGLGTVATGDIAGAPPGTLVRAMKLAPDHDMIARQYTDAFREVIEHGLVKFLDVWERKRDLTAAVRSCFLEFLATYPDSLIVRKCGKSVAEQAAKRARLVLDCGEPDSAESSEALGALDGWLRADGNRRNPGTSADLTCAVLFLALRGGIISPRL